jgi:cytoskeletal protein CcmA (bactofilin family)
MFNFRDADRAPIEGLPTDASKIFQPPQSKALARPAPQTTPDQRTRLEHHTIIDERLTMKGELESDGDVLVRGKVVGNIRCKVLIVDETAAIQGDVTAEEIVIRGAAKGKMRAGRIRIEKNADVDCELCHRLFSAEEGARVRGTLLLDESEQEEEFESDEPAELVQAI